MVVSLFRVCDSWNQKEESYKFEPSSVYVSVSLMLNFR